MERNPRKLRRVDSNQFIDDEAGERDDEDEGSDECEIDEFEDFISLDGEIPDHGQEEDSDDSVPLTDGQSLAEKEAKAAFALTQIFARSHDALTHRSDDVELQKTGSEIGPGIHQIITKHGLTVNVGNTVIWRVPVKVGREVDVLNSFYQRAQMRGSAFTPAFRVQAAFTRPAIRGWIYVEAPSEKDVALAFRSFHGVWKRRTPEIVPISEAAAVLDITTGLLAIEKGSWVRVKRGRYRGDLAYVSHVEGMWTEESREYYEMATIRVIPRIRPPFDTGAERGKRKRPVHACRPRQELFRSEIVSNIDAGLFPRLVRTVGKRQYWAFDGGTYCNGLLEITINSNFLNIEEVIPSSEEVAMWENCVDEDISAALCALAWKRRPKAMVFWPRDKVRGLTSPYIGQKGVVQSVDQDRITVQFEGDFVGNVQVLCCDLEKYVDRGDHVKVISGPQQGKEGWVIQSSALCVSVLEYGTSTEVEVGLKELRLHDDSTLFYAIHHSPRMRPKNYIFHLQSLWKGMPVQVVFKGPHKGSMGFIRMVAEHFSHSGSCLRDTIVISHTCHLKEQCSSCHHGIVHGHICEKQCARCLLEQKRMAEDEAGVFLDSIKIHVELSGSNGQVVPFDILRIQPSVDIISPQAWMSACWMKTHNGFMRHPVINEINWPCSLDAHAKYQTQRWKAAVVDLIHCQQDFELRRFNALCLGLWKQDLTDDLRNAKIKEDNKFGLTPPWNVSFKNYPKVPWIELPVFPSSRSTPPTSRSRTPDAPDSDDPNPTWNPKISDSVSPDWLNRDMCSLTLNTNPKLQIKIIMAGGSDAYSPEYAFCKGFLLPSTTISDKVNIQLNNLIQLKDVDIRCVLPEHPSDVGDCVVVLAGDLKGKLQEVFQINDDDSFQVGEVYSKNRQEDTTHAKKDLVRVKIVGGKRTVKK